MIFCEQRRVQAHLPCHLEGSHDGYRTAKAHGLEEDRFLPQEFTVLALDTGLGAKEERKGNVRMEVVLLNRQDYQSWRIGPKTPGIGIRLLVSLESDPWDFNRAFGNFQRCVRRGGGNLGMASARVGSLVNRR